LCENLCCLVQFTSVFIRNLNILVYGHCLN
jgi:hypothetical protein